jgi:hypothetical protein
MPTLSAISNASGILGHLSPCLGFPLLELNPFHAHGEFCEGLIEMKLDFGRLVTENRVYNLPMRTAPAVCELDGPIMTGPMISKMI